MIVYRKWLRPITLAVGFGLVMTSAYAQEATSFYERLGKHKETVEKLSEESSLRLSSYNKKVVELISKIFNIEQGSGGALPESDREYLAGVSAYRAANPVERCRSFFNHMSLTNIEINMEMHGLQGEIDRETKDKMLAMYNFAEQQGRRTLVCINVEELRLDRFIRKLEEMESRFGLRKPI